MIEFKKDQKRIMAHAENHGLRSSALPDGRVLVESTCVYKRDVYTVTTKIGTIGGLYHLLGY
jgi:hypothetical protein